MEINQATQTFLLFFFIFITSLLGFAFYIKYSKKTSKISLIDAVQTALLIVGIFTLLVFGGSYHFVLSDIDPSEQPLRDALSITAGFFGGFATLTAAFIASRLFNDWKDEQLGVTRSQISKEVLEILVKLTADAESYYFKATYYADIYEQQHSKDLSREYLFSTILEARNSHQMKAEYNAKLDSNLIIFFEKIKLYETVFGVVLLTKEDKEFNFTVYFYTINAFLSSIIEGDEVKIKFLKNAVSTLQEKFKINYYVKLIEIFKKNITFSE